MRLQLQYGLPFTSAMVGYRGRQIVLDNVLIDTGSAGTIFSADRLAALDVRYEPDDPVHRIRGVGGAEFVFTKRLDGLSLGDIQAQDFAVEVGAMEYGFAIDGIIGMDFLTRVGAIIDLSQLEVTRPTSKE